MKKLIVFIFLIVLLCCVNLPYINKLNLSEIFPNAKVEVYIEQKAEMNELKYINSGKGKIVFLKIEQLHNFLKNNKVLGYTLKIKNETLNSVFEKLQIKMVDYICGAYYGVSGIFSKKTNNTSGYNFQCVKVNSEIFVGTPILLGSY